MKKEDISDALNFLDDDLLEETNALRMTPQKRPSVIQVVASSSWIKWGSMAAALVIIVGAVGINVLPMLFNGGSKMKSENTMAPELMSIASGVWDRKSMEASDEFEQRGNILLDGIGVAAETEESATVECAPEGCYVTAEVDELLMGNGGMLPPDWDAEPGLKTSGAIVGLEYVPVYMDVIFDDEKAEDGIVLVYYNEACALRTSLDKNCELWVEKDGSWLQVVRRNHEEKTEEKTVIGCDGEAGIQSSFTYAFTLRNFDLSEYSDRVYNYKLVKKVVFSDGSYETEGEISCEFSR